MELILKGIQRIRIMDTRYIPQQRKNHFALSSSVSISHKISHFLRDFARYIIGARRLQGDATSDFISGGPSKIRANRGGGMGGERHAIFTSLIMRERAGFNRESNPAVNQYRIIVVRHMLLANHKQLTKSRRIASLINVNAELRAPRLRPTSNNFGQFPRGKIISVMVM